MNISIDLPWSPPVVQYQSSTKFVLSSFQLWVLRWLRYAFFPHFWQKKICTEFIAVLTIRIVWVICSLVLCSFIGILHSKHIEKFHIMRYGKWYRRNMGKIHFIEKNLIKYHALYAQIFFQPKTAQQNLNFLCQRFMHISFSKQRKKFLLTLI